MARLRPSTVTVAPGARQDGGNLAADAATAAGNQGVGGA